ncbi:hypothetical protein [Anaerotalea alkaliphila]|uniref:NERD domain-containing protein n=1 Tax=Anaerotalea alkaliphila TaxID=2662126 RepID=A0A7X5KLW0_9FIRM|nr:hypothetical protein [Anaerotalea alkaliphila]NDL66329.1 hypothetical protein [Anaerotalea alkaliphila]
MEIKQRGDFGYMEGEKRKKLHQSLLFTALFMGAYLVGHVTTGSRANAMTLASALLILPAAQYFTRYLLFTRYRPGTREQFGRVEGLAEGAALLCDMIMVRNKQTVFFQYILVNDRVLVGVIEPHKSERPSNNPMAKAKATAAERKAAAAGILEKILQVRGIKMEILVLDSLEEALAVLGEMGPGKLQPVDRTMMERNAEILLDNCV